MLSKELFFDVDSNALVVSATDLQALPSSDWLALTYKAVLLVKLHLINSDGTPYSELADGVSASFSIDNDFVDYGDDAEDPGLMVKTLNTSINLAEDWAEADIASGKFSIRCDCATEGFGEKCGTSEQASGCKGELKIYDATSQFIGVIKFPVLAYNLQDDDDGISPSPTVNYYTKAEVDALLAGIGLYVVHVADFAGLPASPTDEMQRYIDDLHMTATYDAMADKWYNEMGGEITAEG